MLLNSYRVILANEEAHDSLLHVSYLLHLDSIISVFDSQSAHFLSD